MTDQPALDPLDGLDFPTVVACMGGVQTADGSMKGCPVSATRIVALNHRLSEDGTSCHTNRYPVCAEHVITFRAAAYRTFFERGDVVWKCLRCDTVIADPDQIIESHPLFGTGPT